MFTLKRAKTAFCDVDRTLIMWQEGSEWHAHKLHIKLLEQFKYQGFGIVVWSAGSWEWAEKAISLLGIEHLVDICLSKPDWFLDDKKSEEFMPELNRIYLTDEYSSSNITSVSTKADLTKER